MKVHSIYFTASILAALFGAPLKAQTSLEQVAHYRLQPSDVLEIHYRYTPEFNQNVTVQPDGFVFLEIAGNVKLVGLSLEEAKEIIQAKASQRLKDPEITIVLKEFEKPYFVVAGEVQNPGRFEMHGTITAIAAIAMAGGFKNSAKQSQALLFREVGRGHETQILNLKAAMTGSEPNTELHSGDMLIIPPNRVSTIQRGLFTK